MSNSQALQKDGKKMQWKMERYSIPLGFVAAVAIFAFAGWESYQNMTRAGEAMALQKHTYEVSKTLDETLVRLVDAETGQRGYLLTGDEAYLAPYRAAIKNLDQAMSHLKDLTSDNPNQHKRIQTMEPIIGKKLAELQNTIDLRREKGSIAANQVVVTGSGKGWMDEIRALASEMANAESDLLRLRTQSTNESLARSSRTIAAGVVVGISLLALCFGLLARELSERKRAQEALGKNERWFSTTLGSIGDAVIATDMSGAVTFMNPVAQSLTGWSLEEARSKPMDLVFEIVNKDTRRPVENPLKKVVRERKVVGLANHTVLISKNGSEFDIEDSAAPIVTGAGEDIGVVLVFRDVTQLKRAGEELRQSQERLQLMVENVVDYSILTLDQEGRVVSWNAGAERIKGYRADEILGQHFSKFYPHEDSERGKPQHELEVAAAEGRSADEGWRVRKDGSTFWANVVITALRDESGALRGFAKVTRDMTESKLAQEALVHAKDEAERANKFKDQFLSTMSHELRTPLNAVLGFSDLLADERYGSLNERQKRYVSNIHSGGQHLLKLISDILDLSKIEAGRMDLAIQDVPIESAFSEVLSSLRPLAEKKSQTLSQNAQAQLIVRADITRLRQMLVNLAGNAIKFTPEGGRIELEARQTNGQIRIEVRDTGPGIPPEEQKRIFQAFYRLRQSGEATEGTGLGLAITQRLAELHGSKLGLDSQVGQGSCFYFSLPPGVPTRQLRAPEVKVSVSHGEAPKVLVIEDDRDSAQVIQSYLTSSGYESLSCDQPQNAAKMVAEFRPDVITLDLLMKPSNGWEVLLQLKRDPRTANIPVIVVSIVDQPAIATTLGADEYLVKPVDKASLLAAVRRCLASKRGAPSLRPILIVEDDTPTREIIAELLNAQGYAVTTAVDGAQARELVAAALPELVILDLIIPKVSGFDLLAEWRANLRTADLPVFVLTSKDLNGEEEKYLRKHAESLFRKQQPWQQALTEQLQRVLKSDPVVNS
jgi:two-component system sensor histidine kinase EvgS